MATLSEKTKALCAYYSSAYNDFLNCVLNCGGIVFHSQMARLLFNNRSDTKTATRLGEDFYEAAIFSTRNICKNKVYQITSTGLRSLGYNSDVQPLNFNRLKLSALIFESYLKKRYYGKGNPAEAMRKRLVMAGIGGYMPHGVPHIPQLEHFIDALGQRGYSTVALQAQLTRMTERASFAKQEDRSAGINLTKEADLYTLSCKNIYLSGVKIVTDSFGNNIPCGIVDIYYIFSWNAPKMAANIVDAKRIVESIIGNNANSIITVHSLDFKNQKYEADVRRYLSQYPEYYYSDFSDLLFEWYGKNMNYFNGNTTSAFR